MQAISYKFIKLLLALAVVLGIVGLAFHSSHALGDKNHHEDTCRVCAVYHTVSHGVASAPVVPVALYVVVLLLFVGFHSQRLNSFDLSLIHSGLDPPRI